MDVDVAVDSVSVTIKRVVECRTTSRYDEEFTAAITSEWKEGSGSKQTWNIILAAGLGVVGTGILAAPCEQQDDDGTTRDCTSDEKRDRQVTGGVTLGLAVVPLIALIYNSSLTGERREVRKRMGQSSTAWKTCESETLPRMALQLQMSETLLAVGTTDDEGRVVFPITDLPQRMEDRLVVRGKGRTLGTIRLEGTPLLERSSEIRVAGEQMRLCIDAVSGRRYSGGEGLDIRTADTHLSETCEAEASHRGLLGKALEQAIQKCRREGAVKFCRERQALLEQGINPAEELEAERERARERAREAMRANWREWERRVAAASNRAADAKLRKLAKEGLTAQMKAPATTKIVGEEYVGCPGGIAATLTADSQNSFGAYVRGTYCVQVNDSGGVQSISGGACGQASYACLGLD
ncbi:MAG: hypothetical protein AB7S68_17325 [Polyangiaceae bacterium]